MKEESLALVENIPDPTRKLNLLREYLQAFALRSLHESEAFNAVAFVGGTALRFLYNVPRFSEDLDFSVIDHSRYKPENWLKKLKRDMTLAGYECTISWKSRNTVNVAWIRVSGLLYLAGIGSRIEQNLSIKLEFDTRPPLGALLERTVINRHLTFALAHYALESLFSGKLHALVTRGHPKGRDWYDLVWFGGQRPAVSPNITLLQNALDQTEGTKTFSAEQWPTYLKKKLAEIDVATLAEDVNAFLERPEDRLLITRDSLLSILKKYG
jgi:hypothetical protein